MTLTALINELARRAKIGNGLDYHYALKKMRERQERMHVPD